MRATIPLIILILIASILWIPSVLAVTLIWTSTSDFDSGSKAVIGPGANGNFGIETRTDNLGIADGSFEIANIKGDRFTFADTNGNTFKWNSEERGTDADDCSALAISGGVFTSSITTGFAAECVLDSDVSVSGDLDFQIRGSTPVGGTNRAYSVCLYNEAGTGCNPIITLDSATVDGIWYRFLVDSTLSAFTVTNGVATAVGTDSSVPADPMCLRMTRIGSTVTWYYSTTAGCPVGASWTQDEQTTFTTSSSLYLYISAVNNGATDGTVEFDDAYLASGIIGSGGYRTSAAWISPTQTSDGTVPFVITVAYSGASASGYIDGILVVDSSGITLFEDPTDVTSGSITSAVVPFSLDLVQDWGIRINLAGSGAASAAIESITVETQLPPSGQEPSPGGFPGFEISCSSDPYMIRCMIAFPSPGTAGISISETQWYIDGSFAGSGESIDPQRQSSRIRTPIPLAIYRGTANITVIVVLSNGQTIQQSYVFLADHSWVTFLLVFGSLMIVSLAVLRWTGRLERIRRIREDRKAKREENWRWKLFERD